MKVILDFVTNSSEADYYDCSDDCAYDCDCNCDCNCDCDYDCLDCDCIDCVCIEDGDCNSYGYPLDYDEWGYD